jgi:diguanylate cyclase (GGDEF)-like protein/PAS domain S-box-containing protein
LGAILCVDDDKSTLHILKKTFEKSFKDVYSIYTSLSPIEALETINQLNDEGIELELIVSDYLMPQMTGDEFLFEASKISPRSKKILLTAKAENQNIIDITKKIDLYRFVVKPWDRDDLILTVSEALKSFKQEKELKHYAKYLEQSVEKEHLANKTYLNIINRYLIASKTDVNGIIIDVSDAMCEMTGYTKDELIGQSHNIIRHPDISGELYKDMWETITSDKVWEGEIKNKKKDGSSYWVKTTISPTHDEDGNIIGYGSIRIDITDKKRVEELSVTDELTKLYNRRFFNTIFHKEIARAKREKKLLGFAIFDVDNFKLYNDNYGHHKGDIALKNIAKKLKSTLQRPGDYAFRLGGEEFGVLVYDTTLDGFTSLIENIRSAIFGLKIEHKYNGSYDFISASFGGTVFSPDVNASRKVIYQLADKLLYFSKKNGRNRIKIEDFSSIDQSNFENESEAVNQYIARKLKFEKNQHKLFNSLIENSSDLIFVLQDVEDNSSKIVFSNETAKERLGYTLEELQKLTIEQLIKSLDENTETKKYAAKLKRYKEIKEYGLLVAKDGSSFPIEASIKSLNYNNTSYKVAIVRDITNRFNYIKDLEENLYLKTNELEDTISKLRSYASAIDENSIVTVSDTKGYIKYANEKFYEVSGFSKDEIIGKKHSIVKHPDVPKEVFKGLWETISSKKIWKGQIKNRKKDGGYYMVQTVIVPILDTNGEIFEYIATRYEITEIHEKTLELEKLAKTDQLTGLYNRIKLNQVLENIQSGSLALIDINNFKQINEFYGDKIGDKVIIRFSEILKKKLSDTYQLFHLQGDEFAILDVSGKKNDFKGKLKKIIKYFNNETINLDEKIFYLNITVSISFEDPKILLSTVNLAHTFAKENKITFNIYNYESSLEKEYENNFKWVSKIKKAINEDRIEVFFQSIVNTETKELVKYESLVRLIDEKGKEISPYFFLDIAKKANYYPKITRIVLEKSIQFLEKSKIDISINITIEDILNKRTMEFLYNKLENCNYCDKITFELVESEGIESYSEINTFIKKIKSYGCKLAIDDFGTGYSNFEYLIKLNADYIKIDGSLIKNLDINEDHFHIVKMITQFAKVKNIKLIAEFVSEESIYEKIKLLDIDYSQGFLFSKPQRY